MSGTENENGGNDAPASDTPAADPAPAYTPEPSYQEAIEVAVGNVAEDVGHNKD